MVTVDVQAISGDHRWQGVVLSSEEGSATASIHPSRIAAREAGEHLVGVLEIVGVAVGRDTQPTVVDEAVALGVSKATEGVDEAVVMAFAVLTNQGVEAQAARIRAGTLLQGYINRMKKA